MSACSQSSIWNQWQTEIIDGPKWPQYGIIHTGMSQNLKNELIWNEWTEIVYGIYCIPWRSGDGLNIHMTLVLYGETFWNRNI